MAIPSFFRRNPGCGSVLLWGGIGLVVLVIFRAEIGFAWRLVSGVPFVLAGNPPANFPTADELIRTIAFIGVYILILFGLFWYLLYLISDSVLPVRTAAERNKAYTLWRDFSNSHRARLFVVSEGQMVKEPDAKTGQGKGVAVVDLTSAIVLEGQWAVRAHDHSRRSPNQPAKASRFPMARVGKPGVVFIERGEKVRGVVSLRKQTRVNVGALGQTKDGIEVKATVVSIFTVGQPPDILKVAYCGDPIRENLRVLTIDPATRRIKSISDELEPDDKAEIDHFAQDEYLPYSDPNVPLEMGDKLQDRPPYAIDDERVMAAVFSQGRDVNDSKVDSWTDLPPIVATGVFRDLIALENYDSLVNPEESGPPRVIRDFKPLFGRKMRHQGVMSYQFVHRKDEAPPRVGDKVAGRDYRVAAVRSLTAQRLLRDRGIKVLVATFGELIPTNTRIPEQRLDNWSARWESEADEERAEYELKVRRIRNKERAEAERVMIKKLLEIVQSSEYSKEAMTLLVLQSLEQYAQDPNTRRMLPSETFNSLRNLRLWLLPDDTTRQAAIVDGYYALPRPDTGTDSGGSATLVDDSQDSNATEVA